MTHQERLQRLAAVFAFVLAFAALVPGGLALADDDWDDWDTASQTPDDAEEESTEVEEQGYYTANTSEALPPTLRNEFPPGVVCLLFPEACTDEARAITGPIDAIVQSVELDGGPVQPVPPGSMPVGMLGGQERYASALKFTLPEPPEGMEIAHLELVLHESVPAMAVESPAFRAAVRAAIAQVADDPSPDPFLGVLSDVVTMETDVVSADFPGVEICPVLEPWEAEDNQDAEAQPDRDCIFGGTGVPDDEGRWSFDLTLSAQSWYGGELENHGVVIAPQGAENLEFGDPDYTTNFLMAFEGAEADEDDRPFLRVAWMEALEDFDDAGATDFGDEFDDGGFDDGGFDDTGSDFDTGGSNDFDAGGFDSGSPSTGTVDEADELEAPAPETAEEPEVDEEPAPEVAEPEQDDAMAAGTRRAPEPSDPWYLWLLLPVAASGMWWFSRVLDVEPELDGLTGGGGALSRLVERIPGVR